MSKKPKVQMAQGSWMLLPPKPDVCSECAVKHEPGAPHNKDSLYYQMRFHAEHGRYPQWSDAIAHCTPEVQADLKEYLERQGVWSEPVKGMPKEERVARKIAGMPTHSDKPDGGEMNVTVLKLRREDGEEGAVKGNGQKDGGSGARKGRG